MSTAARISCIVCIVVTSGLAGAEVASVDPFMGDWQGSGTDETGQAFDFVAQVIAQGDGQYRVNILSQFDVREKPMHVMDGRLEGRKYTYTADNGAYSGEGTLDGDVFRGFYKGDVDGKYEMKRVVRLSPTMGTRPLKGGIVLFDGTNLDQWERMGGGLGRINLATLVGGDNSAAYLRTTIISENARKAVLEVGSDDGIKVWLNGKLVHTNNASRGLTPGQDKIPVDLAKGANRILMKITNGGGDWAACAKLVDDGGKALDTIAELKNPGDEDSATKDYLNAAEGFLTKWLVSGPYRQDGKSGPDLMDIAFDPEKDTAQVDWKPVKVEADPKKPRWILKDGAMQVNDGNIRTKRSDFTDFRLHVEFKSPFMPNARGQGRGNSGVYLQNRYEVQVLDSYGLEGADNECGGVYQVARPLVNMCAPPEQWQTYDIEFTAPKMVDGQRQPAILTVVHNGVKIHDRIRIPGPTGGALDGNVLEPGGIYLQDHGNAVQFRNIWLLPTAR